MKNIYNEIRIVTADDHPVYLNGLNSLIDKTEGLSVVDSASNGVELLNSYRSNQPDILMIDLKMPKMDGIEVVKEIRKFDSDIGIICLSGYEESELIAEMIEAGANGYIIKNTNPDSIIESIFKVYNKERYFCRQVMDIILERPNYNIHKKMTTPTLTNKELEVVRLLCHQLTSIEISEKMSISPRTVEQHLSHVRDKLNVQNSLGIAVYAIKHRLIKLENSNI